MVYLLLVNPEMLMPGARCQIFLITYDKVRKIFKDNKPPEDADELARKIIQEEKKNKGITSFSLLCLVTRTRAHRGDWQSGQGEDVESVPWCLGGDALLLDRQVQRAPTRQGLGHRR
jgi:hypothetical protein